jgi:hypothetical protein
MTGSDPDESRDEPDDPDESLDPAEEAEEIAEEVAEENPDPITRREAVEQALEAEGLSDGGAHIGEHNE